jgi:hypothetical protein
MTGSDMGYLGPEKVSMHQDPWEKGWAEPGGRFSCDGSGETEVRRDTNEVDAGAVGSIGDHRR